MSKALTTPYVCYTNAFIANALQKYKKYLIPYYIYEKNLHFMIKTSLFLWCFRTISVLLHFRINNSTD